MATERPPGRAWPWFLLGGILAGVFLLGLAECFVRLFPPQDLHSYLGEESPLTGIYAPDPELGVRYRSWEAFCEENDRRLRPYLPLSQSALHGKMWAFFGNSFVQAPGMLADTVRQTLPDRPVFYLGRNEPLFLRFSQVQLLLGHGLQPERIFVELMPVDLLQLGEQPLRTLRVTSRGALTYEPRLPKGLAGAWVRHSRLGLTAWCRAGLQRGNRRFSRSRLPVQVDPLLQQDVCRLFAFLARVTREHRVPVTVLLIPNYAQVCQGEVCGFQDTFTPLLRGQGFDVFDPRDAFRSHAEPADLFLPDKHFNAEGNRILLAELLAHLGTLEAGTPGGQP